MSSMYLWRKAAVEYTYRFVTPMSLVRELLVTLQTRQVRVRIPVVRQLAQLVVPPGAYWTFLLLFQHEMSCFLSLTHTHSLSNTPTHTHTHTITRELFLYHTNTSTPAYICTPTHFHTNSKGLMLGEFVLLRNGYNFEPGFQQLPNSVWTLPIWNCNSTNQIA